MAGERDGRPTVLIANPGSDVYGSDLQMLESVRALVGAGHRVVVVSGSEGPLTPRLVEAGAQTLRCPVPVLMRAHASPRGLVNLAWQAVRAFPSMLKVIRTVDPDVVYVNTVTLPWWLAAGRWSRRRTLCHVHEAEEGRGLVQRGLAAPLRLSHLLLLNSRAAVDALTTTSPGLAGRIRLVLNGVEGPPRTPTDATFDRPARLVVIGRLAHRKSQDVALEVLSLLLAQGHDVALELAGSVFPGNEAFEDALRERAQRADLAGRVTFSGYVSPIWPAVERSDIVLAPARLEPFGNAVVEAQLARRAVVAAAVQGHLETVLPDRTGVLVPVEDPAAMAAAVAALIADPSAARALAASAQAYAEEHFSADRYRSEIVDAITCVTHQR